MKAALRGRYLAELGIDAWVLRGRGAALQPGVVADGPAAEPPARDEAQAPAGREQPGLCIGPGDSRLLLVCARPEEAATPIAADIARSLDSVPVWAWCSAAGGQPETTLEAVVRERLFTRIVSFGVDAGGIGAELTDGCIGTAQWLAAESIPVLAGSAAARRALWASLCALKWYSVARGVSA